MEVDCYLLLPLQQFCMRFQIYGKFSTLFRCFEPDPVVRASAEDAVKHSFLAR